MRIDVRDFPSGLLRVLAATILHGLNPKELDSYFRARCPVCGVRSMWLTTVPTGVVIGCDHGCDSGEVAAGMDLIATDFMAAEVMS